MNSASLLASTFALVFLAELPGKTTLASFFLSARTRPLPVFLGAAGAFLLHTAIAVALGRLLSHLPKSAVEVGAGVLFIVIAGWLWLERVVEPDVEPPPPGRAAFAAFGVAFVGQWGDPSQLATAAAAARHPEAPLAVGCGAALGLWAVTALAVALGHFSKRRVPTALLHKGAAAVFAVLGAALIAHSVTR